MGLPHDLRIITRFILSLFLLCFWRGLLSHETKIPDKMNFDLRDRLTPAGTLWAVGKDDMTLIAQDLAGMTTFHPLTPWRQLGWFKFELGSELAIANPSSKMDAAYGGTTAPTWLGARLHFMIGLPKGFGAGILFGGISDLRRGSYTSPDGVTSVIRPSSYTLYGGEVWYDIWSWNTLLFEPNLGARLAVDYAHHNRGQLSLINTELSAGLGLRILIVGAYLGLGGILSFPQYSSLLPRKGSPVVANYRITLGTHIPLGILRFLVEMDWVTFRQMNLFAKMALYW